MLSNPGAQIEDIIQDCFAISEDKNICRKCIEDVFLVCGGNAIENNKSKAGPKKVTEHYKSLVDYVGYIFPNAGINVVSILPRRLRYRNHLSNMICINNNLAELCESKENCRFIDIFSYFLKDKSGFFANHCNFALNDKLFVNDQLHFSRMGNSVLGKVVIGVTYRPKNINKNK